MQNKFKSLVASILFFYPLIGSAQKSGIEATDTVFVYETVTVYDTVFVYDTIKIVDDLKIEPIATRRLPLNILQFDTVNRRAFLITISKNQTATFPINGIILNENLKNSESMKKLSFFGVVLFAFQSMVVAQTQFGASVGGGAWWAKSNGSDATSMFSPGINAGLFLTHPLGNHLLFKAELNYTYLIQNGSYKAVVDTVNWVVVGESESASDFHQISIPLQVGYKLGRFSPFLGIEGSYRVSESWVNSRFGSLGLLGGLSYAISDRFSLALNGYFGLTKDYEYRGTIINPLNDEYMGKYHYFWRSCRLGMSLYYTFKKKSSGNE